MAAPVTCGSLEEAEARSFEDVGMAPSSFARDAWMAQHVANRAKAGPSTEVVLLGDSITDAWALTLPPFVCDALRVEPRINALTSQNHMGFLKGAIMQTCLIWVWVGTYVFGSAVRVSAMAWVLRMLMDFPRPAFVQGVINGVGKDTKSCVSMGIMGDRTRHLLWRVQHGELDLAWGAGQAPKGTPLKVVVMLIGVNNLGFKEYSPEETARHIVNCAAVIATRYAGVQVLVHQLLPADNQRTDTRPTTRANVAKVNHALVEELRRLKEQGKKNENDVLHSMVHSCLQSNVHLIDDVSPLFENRGGSCNLGLLPDELHLNEAGYGIWAAGLAPHIAAAKGRWQASDEAVPWQAQR